MRCLFIYIFLITIVFQSCDYESKEDLLLQQQAKIKSELEQLIDLKVEKIDLVDSNFIQIHSNKKYLLLTSYDCAKYVYTTNFNNLLDSLQIIFIKNSDTLYFDYRLQNFDSEHTYLSLSNDFLLSFKKKDFNEMRSFFSSEYDFNKLSVSLKKINIYNQKIALRYFGCYYFQAELNTVGLCFGVGYGDFEDVFLLYFDMNSHKIIDFTINNKEILF